MTCSGGGKSGVFWLGLVALSIGHSVGTVEEWAVLNQEDKNIVRLRLAEVVDERTEHLAFGLGWTPEKKKIFKDAVANETVRQVTNTCQVSDSSRLQYWNRTKEKKLKLRSIL